MVLRNAATNALNASKAAQNPVIRARLGVAKKYVPLRMLLGCNPNHLWRAIILSGQKSATNPDRKNMTKNVKKKIASSIAKPLWTGDKRFGE